MAGAATHPLRHVLTRAVGVTAPLELDMVTDTLMPDDIFLLCSDGLYGVIDEAEITAQLERRDGRAAAEALVARCLERGAPDNVTLVTVAASETTLLHLGSTMAGSAG